MSEGIKVVISRFRYLLALVLLMVTSAAQPRQSPNYAVGKLENGLRYLIMPSAKAGSVKLGVTVFTGYFYESATEFGSAHVVEHILSGYYNNPRRTRTNLLDHPVLSLSNPRRNASTGDFATRYEFEVKKEEMLQALEVLRGIVHGAKFSRGEIVSQRGVVIAEAIGSGGTEGDNGLRKMALEARFPGIHVPVTGAEYRQALLRLQPKQVQAFYDKWYHPANAIIYVGGDIEPSESEGLIREVFSDLPRQALTDPPKFGAPSRHYFYYRSHGQRHSKVYLHFLLGEVGARYTAVSEAVLNDATDCLDQKLISSGLSRNKGWSISIDKQGAIVPIRDGFELAISAKPAEMVLALNDAAQLVAQCRKQLLEDTPGLTFRSAAETAIGSDSTDYENLYVQYILSSAAYDEPALRNYVNGTSAVMVSKTAFSRKEFIDSLFSTQELVLMAYDPANSPSILSSAQQVRAMLAAGMATTSQVDFQSPGKPADRSYELGRALLWPVSDKIDSIDKSASRSASAGGQVTIAVRSNKGYLDLPSQLVNQGRALSEFLRKSEYNGHGTAAAGEAAVKIEINPSDSIYIVRLGAKSSLKFSDALNQVRVAEKELDKFILDIDLRNIRFFSPAIDRQIFETYLRSGRIVQCPGVNAHSADTHSQTYDNVIKEIFAKSDVSFAVGADLNTGVADAGAGHGGGFRNSEKAKLKVAYKCDLGRGDTGKVYLAVRSSDPTAGYSDSERVLAKLILEVRMFRRLREREGGVYVPSAEVYKTSDGHAPAVVVAFSSMIEDAGRLRTAAIEEIRALITRGVSHRDVAQACYMMDPTDDGCSGPERVKKIGGIFRKLRSDTTSSFVFRR